MASHGHNIQVAASTTDPMAGGDPNIEENLEKIEKKENPIIHIGPSIVPRENPDGTVELANPGAALFIGVGPKAASPKLPDVPGKQKDPDATNTSPPTGTIASELKPGPTMASPGSPGQSAPNIQVPVAKPDASAESVEALFGEARPAKTLKTPEEIATHPFVRALKAAVEGDRETLEACKMELPPDIAKRLIPGVIGPGPWASQPIRVPFGQEATKKMRTMVPDDGSPNRCHICGALTLTPNGGLLSLDHQPPQALNVLGENDDIY